MKTTCKHFRYRVPQEDADELRELDDNPCDVCDNREHCNKKRLNGNVVLWKYNDVIINKSKDIPP